MIARVESAAGTNVTANGMSTAVGATTVTKAGTITGAAIADSTGVPQNLLEDVVNKVLDENGY